MVGSRMRRAEQDLDRIITKIEGLVNEEPLNTHPTWALEKMVRDLHDIRLSMKKVDKARNRKSFWRLSRRGVRISIKVINLLSKA
jgi:hypothetical protein